MDDATYESKIRARDEMWNRWGSRNGSYAAADFPGSATSVSIGLLNGRLTAAAGSATDGILLYDVSSGQRVGKPMQSDGSIKAIQWCPQSENGSGTIITLDTGSRIRWWDPILAREAASPCTHLGANKLALSSRSQDAVLASAGDDGMVKLWNLATKDFLCAAWFGDDGTEKVMVIEGSGRSHVEVFGKPLISASQRVVADTAAEDLIGSLSLTRRRITAMDAGMRNGSVVITAANDNGEIFIWRLKDQPVIESFYVKGQIEVLRVFNYGAQFVAACGTIHGQVMLVELSTGKVVGASKEPLSRLRAPISAMIYSSMKEFEMVEANFAALIVGRRDASIEVRSIDGIEVGHAWLGHTAQINSLDICDINGWPIVVSASEDETVRFWDLLEYAKEPTSQTKGEAFAERLEELRLADLDKNHRGTSNLASNLGVSSTTIWSWVHGRSLPKDVDLVYKLEEIFFGAHDRFHRGELVYLYEEAKREKTIASADARDKRSAAAKQPRFTPKEYDLFISYTHKDRPLVEKFAEQLKAKRVRIWYDKWEMQAGDVLRERIGEGILKAANFVVLLSPASLKSRWVRYELNSGMIEEIERDSVRVIPAFGPGIKPENVPPDLRAKLAIDLRSPQGIATAVDQIVALVQPEKRVRKELIARLRKPASDPEEIKEKRRLSRPGRDQAISAAALHGLINSAGSTPLIAVSELVIGNFYGVNRIARAIKALPKRSNDGGMLILAASLLQDGRFYFQKIAAIDRYLKTANPAHRSSVVERSVDGTAEIVARDIARYLESEDQDIRNGIILAQLRPSPQWASLTDSLSNSAVRAAIEYAEARIPGLSSLVLKIAE